MQDLNDIYWQPYGEVQELYELNRLDELKEGNMGTEDVYHNEVRSVKAKDLDNLKCYIQDIEHNLNVRLQDNNFKHSSHFDEINARIKKLTDIVQDLTVAVSELNKRNGG